MRRFSEAFWTRSHVSQRYLEVWDVLFCVLKQSDGFSWVLSCSERHLNIQKCHLTLPSELRHFCRFRNVHLRFLGVLWRSGVFWRILKRSHGIWVVLNDSSVLMSLKRFWNVSEFYETLLDVLVYSEAFLKVLRHSLTFWDVMLRFDALSCFETFSDVLGCFGVLRGVLMSFERHLIGSEGFLCVLSNSLKFWRFSE